MLSASFPIHCDTFVNVVEPGNEAVNRTFAIRNYLLGWGLWIKKFLDGITLGVPVEDLRE